MGKKRKNKKSGKFTGFFKNFGLLLRCLFSAVAYCALWIGIAFCSETYGILILIIGILAVIVSVLTNIVIPISRLK